MYISELECYLVQYGCMSYRFKDMKAVAKFIGTYPGKVKRLISTGEE